MPASTHRGEGVCSLTPGSPTGAGDVRTRLQTQRGEGRKEIHAGTRGALQICMEILTAAELMVLQNVLQTMSEVYGAFTYYLKTREMGCVPCKGVILNISSKGWLVLANIT